MVQVTERAAHEIKRILAGEGQDGYGLRFGLTDGGCSGYTYLLDFEPGPDDDDHVFEDHGLKVFIHPMHLPFVSGSIIGWRDDLMETGIRVENPNVKRECGCGVSVEF